MNICIFGDSWGCGEWDFVDGNYTVTHAGIAEFFKNAGHKVTNISECGNSNKNSLNDISKQNLNLFDYVFWFQTDPLRDLRSENHPWNRYGEKFHSIKTVSMLVDTNQLLLKDTYEQLNLFNKEIYCIGGCSKLNIDLLMQYKNLIPLMPSIPEFLCKDYQHPDIWHSDWLNCIEKNNFSLNDLDILIEYKNRQDLLYTEKYKEYFWPDGAHPNRHGHKIIFDHICNIIKDS